ncbi:uncharacterized protein LOC126573451 [Anopheles aquasalis]|uniref:uncharacterized protein LOC126573451 n=1 Tax=Anopheles aquasalis TaxID=42839 RepID=UPI00215B1FD9|nr:uncharacterized protein LOC126573451 [Anopheles aquasalis]
MMHATGSGQGAQIALLLLLVVLGNLLQVSTGELAADLGVNQKLTAASTIATAAQNMRVTFDDLDAYNTPIVNDYPPMVLIKTAITNITVRIAASGMVLGDEVVSLTLNSSNDVYGAFAPVFRDIDSLRKLLQTGLSVPMSAIASLNNVTHDKLNINYGDLLTRLTTLNTTLDVLSRGLAAARSISGSSPTVVVPLANINKFVTPVMYTDVKNALLAIKATLGSTINIAQELIGNIADADDFITSISTGAIFEMDIMASIDLSFQEEMVNIGANIGFAVTDMVDQLYTPQTDILSTNQSDLEAISTYNTSMQPTLTALNTSLNNVYDYAALFTNYTVTLNGSIASTGSIDNLFKTEFCPVIVAQISSLLASGPYATFCYKKYSDLLTNQFSITSYDQVECKDIEKTRLYMLQQMADLIVRMIIYDVENLTEAISVCIKLSDGSHCMTSMGTHYQTLSQTVQGKLDYLQEYTEQETGFTLQRLSLCATSAKYAQVIAVEGFRVDMASCDISGANAV